MEGSDDACPINALDGQVLHRIFSRLSPRECAIAGCVQRSWRAAAGDDALWKCHCVAEFNQSLALATDGSSCQSYKGAYVSWQNEFGRYGGLFKRARQCWQGIRAWATENFQELGQTLAEGASEGELADVEKNLGPLPAAFRVLYRLCNGQQIPDDESPRRARRPSIPEPSLFHGLLGGYSLYDHAVNTRLLPLKAITDLSERVNEALHGCLGRKVIIAASFNYNKLFFLDLEDGLVYANTRGWREGELLPCVPAGTSTGPNDGLLRWLEEYSRRLQSGKYMVKDLLEVSPSRGICLFPETGPEMTEAVTENVQVRCSAVFCPELCSLGDGNGGVNGQGKQGEESDKYYFSYSVRMRYLLPGGSASAYPSVQLRSRHWIIRQGESQVEEVRGEAVIGKYPLLRPGEGEFVYQSCSSMTATKGSIEGDLQFVPGSLSSPLGPEFDVQVARFDLQLPEYIY